MSTATLTSKGQITIPKDVRDELGLSPGARVSFERSPSGDIVMRRQPRPLMELSGALRYDGPPVSIEEMDEALGRVEDA